MVEGSPKSGRNAINMRATMDKSKKVKKKNVYTWLNKVPKIGKTSFNKNKIGGASKHLM